MDFKRKILFLSLFISFSLGAIDLDFNFDKQQDLPEDISIDNRILLKIYGKPISVLDVVRKMNLLFYRQYPELVNSPMALYQFYSAQWRSILESVIDDHLMVLDAEEKGIEISDGEVREELEKYFGPDVVFNLDKMGLTLDEAFDLLKTELIVQRMMGMMVHAKALTEVSPKEIRTCYGKHLLDNPPQNQWTYQTINLRDDDHERVALKVYQLLSDQKIPFEEVIAQLYEKCSLSEEYHRTEQELSLSHKAILETLAVGEHSLPVTKGSTTRIFILKAFDRGEPTPFKSLEGKMNQQLTQEYMIRHNQIYREKLRKHYDLTEKYLTQVIPEDLNPFDLR